MGNETAIVFLWSGLECLQLAIALFCIVANLLFVAAIVHARSLHNRCNVLMSILALADTVISVYIVQTRMIALSGSIEWSSRHCFFVILHGIFARSVQSGIGLVLGLDRLAAIAAPFRYLQWSCERYLACLLTPVLFYSIAMTVLVYRNSSPSDAIGVCLIITSLRGWSYETYVLSNAGIAVTVLCTFVIAQIKLSRTEKLNKSAAAFVRHGLNTISIIMACYLLTWVSVIVLSIGQRALLPSTPRLVELCQGFPFALNCGCQFVVYMWRGHEFRRAVFALLAVWFFSQ